MPGFTPFRLKRLVVLSFSMVTVVAAPCGASGAQLQFTRHVLPNGVVVLLSEQRALPIVVLQVLLDAGSRRDPKGKEGLAALTADLLTEGTHKRSALQISEDADAIGARLDTTADVDYAVASLTVLRKYLDRGLELLFDVLLAPAFPASEVHRRREATLAAIRAEEDEPAQIAYRNFLLAVFGDTPYGHPPIGTSTGVARLERKDVQEFYRNYYRPQGTIVVVTGDIEASSMLERLQQVLATWPSKNVPNFTYPEMPANFPRVHMIDKPLTQTNLALGHRGVARNNPDFYALTVMNFILGGGGFTSRLVESVRVQGGLAYSVGSAFTANTAPGLFQVSLQTKNASAREALRRVCAELHRIRSELVSEEELTSAQLYLTGSFPLRLDSNTKIATFLGQMEFFQLGADYVEQYAQRIRSVTREDVLRVAQQYLHPDDLRLVAVGNLSEANLGNAPPCSTEQ